MDVQEVIAARKPFRVTRTEYALMGKGGAFQSARVELVYGVITQMSPQGGQHARAIRNLTKRLVPGLLGRALVQVQLPLALSEDSEPEPDVSLVAPDVEAQIPTAAFLVVEVSGDSLRFDRHVKGRLYAEAGIPEYWVIDLEHRRVERYLAPEGERYTRSTTHGPGETLAPEAFPDVTVPLDEVLPVE